MDDRAQLEGRVASGANWFFWIAGLSIFNSAVVLLGSKWSFVVGLGITQLVDALVTHFAEQLGTGVAVAAFAFDLLVAGVFVMFGVFARKRHEWAFLVGMALYGLDGVLFLLARDWLSFGFHVFALYSIYTGLRAAWTLAKLPPAPLQPEPPVPGSELPVQEVYEVARPPAPASAPPPPEQPPER